MSSGKNQKILITAALPYANGPLHFGHIAGVYLPADCYARFERLQGSDVVYISGSDEYGIAITLNAEKTGIPFQKYVDDYHRLHAASFSQLNIIFDRFSRTTVRYHAPLVVSFYENLKKRGYIEEKETEQLFCQDEERFLADRYVIGTCPFCGYESARGDECGQCGAAYEATDLLKPRSKLTDKPLVSKITRHSFLLLDSFKEFLEKRLQTKPFRYNVQKFVTEFLKNIHPRAITRDLNWGVDVPGEEGKKVFYVWFDAPIGYISATQDWAVEVKKQPDLWKKYWLEEDVKYVQFIGKDNILFHAVIFPMMESGQDLPYKNVDDLVVSEFYTLEGRQFSKSEGHFIDMGEFLEKYSVDSLRYVLAAGAPESSDSDFSFTDFKMRCNADLVGKYGNFINRVAVFAAKNGFEEINLPASFTEADLDFLAAVIASAQKARKHYSDYSIKRASQVVMETASLGNVYFNDMAPWKLVKDEASKERVAAIIFCCLFCQKIMALISYPLMPDTAMAVFESILSNQIEEKDLAGLWNEDFLDYHTASFRVRPQDLLFNLVD